MHIPKTAGVSLSKGLRESLRPPRVVETVHDRVLFGDFSDFDTIHPGIRRTIYLEPKDLPSDADFVEGHISFSTCLKRYPNSQHVTFLREPVSRILSYWVYWRSQSDDHLRLWGRWAERVRMARSPLAEFLSRKEIAFQTDNLYVRMLAWPHELIQDNNFIDRRNDRALLRQAIARLRQFSYVDLIENPMLQANLQAWLGQPFACARENETPRIRPPLNASLYKELTSEALDLLRARARLDLKLWEMLARDRISHQGVEALRNSILMRSVARYSMLLSDSIV